MDGADFYTYKYMWGKCTKCIVYYMTKGPSEIDKLEANVLGAFFLLVYREKKKIKNSI